MKEKVFVDNWDFTKFSLKLFVLLWIIHFVRKTIALFFNYLSKEVFVWDEGWYIKDSYLTDQIPEKFREDRLSIFKQQKGLKKFWLCMKQTIKEDYSSLLEFLRCVKSTFSMNIIKCILIDIVPAIISVILVVILVFGIIIWLKGY